MNKPTQAEIIAAIDYNPQTGLFFWTHHESVYVNVRGKQTATSGVKGHLKIRFQDREYKAHHVAWVIMKGYWPVEVDHENNNRSDNRWSNLREATRQQNQMNRVLSKNSTSGFKGVVARKYGGFEAKIIVSKKYIYLGKFNDPVEAARAYDTAAVKHFGVFAKTNKMLGLIT